MCGWTSGMSTIREKEAEREGDANRHLADYNRECSIVTSCSSRNEEKIWLLESTVGNYSN